MAAFSKCFQKDNIVKLSKLSEAAVHPKRIERQNVSLCLKVFCDVTVTELSLSSEPTHGTEIFISKLVKFFKIVNVKGLYQDQRTRDGDKAVITSPDDIRLQYLLDLATMIEEMGTEKQGQRFKQLTKDTSHAFAHTCRGMVDLTKSLLQSGMNYVCLGHFSSDPIEKIFGKLRQGSGGTYFINVQQVIQKVAIRKN